MAADNRPGASSVELGGLKMTQADLRIMQECRREAFYSRSGPLMIAFSGATHFLVKTGKLSPHPRVGSLFKVVWAGLFGNIIGNITYQPKCNAKFKAEPNSLIGRTMRKRLGEPVLEPTDPAVAEIIRGEESASSETEDSTSVYADLRRRNRQGVSAPTTAPASPKSNDPEPVGRETESEEIPPEEQPMNRRMRQRRNKYGDVIDDD